MSLLRVLAAAAIVGLALLVAPAAITPGFGGGDLIVIFSPVALLWLCAPRVRPEMSAGGSSAPTDVPHITESPADTTP